MAVATPIHWAAPLVLALKQSGTGQAKLDLIRDAMTKRFNHPDHAAKPNDHPDRHLSSWEAIAVLEKAGVGDGTLAKARQLAKTGKYESPAPINPADALPPPPDMPAPARVVESAEEPELKSLAGVSDLTADVDTVGLKPIADPEGDEAKKPAPKKPAPKRRGGPKELLPASKPTEPTSEPESVLGADSAPVEGASVPTE